MTAVGVLGVIPVRMSATRLPGKPLLDIGRRTLVARVHDAASSSGVFDRLVVATDSEEIAVALQGAAEVILTRSDHLTGTDRVAEVAEAIPADVVVNVQGDLPFLSTSDLAAVVAPYREGHRPDMVTVGCPLVDVGQLSEPSVVKVLLSRTGRALYFTRAPVPHGGSLDPAVVLHHLGLYAYRSDVLRRFASLARGRLEELESLEQLRLIEHDFEVMVRRVSRPLIEVNTAEDLARARAAVAEEELP